MTASMRRQFTSTLGSVVIVLAALSCTAAAGAGPAAAIHATAVTPDAASRAGWVWPLPSPHPIVRPFIAPETPYSSGHRGVDIAAPAGSIVRSPADGVIHFSGFVVNRSLVSIDHGGGLLSSFEPVVSTLAEGTTVHRGESIGSVEAGHCAVSCLHFGVRLHGAYLSPLNYLGGLAHSVLLPTRELR